MVAAACLGCVLISFFLSRDVILYNLLFSNIKTDKAKIEQDIEVLRGRLTKCDPRDKQRVKELEDNITKLKEDLKKL